MGQAGEDGQAVPRLEEDRLGWRVEAHCPPEEADHLVGVGVAVPAAGLSGAEEQADHGDDA